ncbi:Glycosyl transferase family 2 [Blastococcus fimeti]|nr:Glycosyl transferase family 2 [Blastococcus fimeti]
MGHSERELPDLSVVIPSYNSAEWLPSTLEACATALAATSWTAEILVVDDGSTDGTADLITSLAADFPVALRVLRQENKGRFLARWAGLQEARAEQVFLLDSRVLMGPGSLAHVEAVMTADPRKTVWNGHCVTDPEAPLVGHFWEVLTHVFWGSYLGAPEPVEFGLETFNQHPKGTGVFIAPRQLLVDACRVAWPTGDAALVSDDTKLIRHIAADVPVRLDPGFLAVYRPRGNVRDFVRHSFGRGTFLVDSFAGTSAGWNAALVGLAAAPVIGLALLAGLVAAQAWTVLGALAGLAVLALAAPAALAARRHCPAKGLRSYLTYVPVFVAPYWAGLLRGLAAHGHLLRSTRRNLPVRTEVAA